MARLGTCSQYCGERRVPLASARAFCSFCVISGVQVGPPAIALVHFCFFLWFEWASECTAAHMQSVHCFLSFFLSLSSTRTWIRAVEGISKNYWDEAECVYAYICISFTCIRLRIRITECEKECVYIYISFIISHTTLSLLSLPVSYTLFLFLPLSISHRVSRLSGTATRWSFVLNSMADRPRPSSLLSCTCDVWGLWINSFYHLSLITILTSPATPLSDRSTPTHPHILVPAGCSLVFSRSHVLYDYTNALWLLGFADYFILWLSSLFPSILLAPCCLPTHPDVFPTCKRLLVTSMFMDATNITGVHVVSSATARCQTLKV